MELEEVLSPIEDRVQIVLESKSFWDVNEENIDISLETLRKQSGLIQQLLSFPLDRLITSRWDADDAVHCCLYSKVLKVALEGDFEPAAYVASWYGSIWRLDSSGKSNGIVAHMRNKEELAAQRENGAYFRWPMGCGMSVIMKLDKGEIPKTAGGKPAKEMNIFTFNHCYAHERIQKYCTSGKCVNWADFAQGTFIYVRYDQAYTWRGQSWLKGEDAYDPVGLLTEVDWRDAYGLSASNLASVADLLSQISEGDW